jgi:plasmid recombination enzyme
MSNNISVSMHLGSGKNAINNMDKIKRADLHNNRKYKNNKNQEIDLSLSKYNVTLVGTKNITEDIKEFYKKEFGEALYNYNKKQQREDRKILDYLEKMNNDTKSNIATEFIFQIGNAEDWENATMEDKQKTVEIFKKAIPILQEKNIKCFNASVHLDETSPHLHLLAVPVIEKQTRGLEKQVSQNKVITLKVLNDIRKEVEKAFIEEYNKIYGTNKELKKGSEITEHLQVKDYKDTKKILEVAKKTADKQVLKEKIEQDYKKLAVEVKEKEKENKNLTNELTRLVEEKENKKQDLEKIKEDIEKIDNIREELNNQYKDIEKLKVEKDSNNSIIEMYKNNAVETREKIDNLKKEFNRLEDERLEKEKENQEQKERIEEQNRIRNTQEAILKDLENAEKIKEERKKRLEELEKENKELNNKIQEQKDKIEILENKINSNNHNLIELEEKEKEILKEVEEKTEIVNTKDKILEVNKMFKYIKNANQHDIYEHFKDCEMFQFLERGEFKENFIQFLETIKEKNTINENVDNKMLKEIKKMNNEYNAVLEDDEDKKEIVEQLNKVDNKTKSNSKESKEDEKEKDDFELSF